jgi:TonB family protein
MTLARESQALIASLALHLLLLLVLVLARQPVKEPRAPLLRLTLPGADAAQPATVRTAAAAGVVPGARRALAARSQLVMPAADGGPPTFQAPVVRRPVVGSGGLLPRPATALAAAVTAYQAGVAPAPVPVSDSATPPPLPSVTRYGLPALRRGIALPYPEELIARGVEADVVMRLTVAEDGTVTGVEVLQSSGLSTVDAEVRQALRQFLFAASAEGPVAGTVQVRYRLERGF